MGQDMELDHYNNIQKRELTIYKSTDEVEILSI